MAEELKFENLFAPEENTEMGEGAQNSENLPKKKRRKPRLELPEIVVDPLDEREYAPNPFPFLVGFVCSLMVHVCLFLILAILTLEYKKSPFRGLAVDGGFTEEAYVEDDPDEGETGALNIPPVDADAPPVKEPLSGEDEIQEDALTDEQRQDPLLVPVLPDTDMDPPEDPGEDFPQSGDGRNPAGNQGATTEDVEGAASPRVTSDSMQPGSEAESKIPKFPTSGELIGRTDPEKRGELLKDGGTPDSELAVLRGLRWLEAHQQIDREQKNWGSWNFDMRQCPGCGGKCGNSGEETSTTAATSLALLAMLGYGNTREQGEFQSAVRRGVYYLSTRATTRKGVPGYDFRAGGDMYTQALCSLALCEAYSMERKKDPILEDLARGSIQWLLWAQNKEGGGWRYMPHQPGDVTVTTWVLMALKSGKMAGFDIPSPTMIGLERFLKSVAHEDGALFSYLPDDEPIRSTTAVGLFAKMFTGTPREAKFLDKGTAQLTEWGYSPTDLYYNYYASMVLRHYGGHRWQQWNAATRDFLIATQEYRGHESGSWYFKEPDKTHNQKGGRLYTTVMAIMTLEVYYRYMPIYQDETVQRKML